MKRLHFIWLASCVRVFRQTIFSLCVFFVLDYFASTKFHKQISLGTLQRKAKCLFAPLTNCLSQNIQSENVISLGNICSVNEKHVLHFYVDTLYVAVTSGFGHLKFVMCFFFVARTLALSLFRTIQFFCQNYNLGGINTKIATFIHKI